MKNCIIILILMICLMACRNSVEKQITYAEFQEVLWTLQLSKQKLARLNAYLEEATIEYHSQSSNKWRIDGRIVKENGEKIGFKISAKSLEKCLKKLEEKITGVKEGENYIDITIY